ncbi:MAG: YggT family protein [Magnetococcales bacterium]|nr:YggT family protein [Magnetococcales bacterium]
MGLFSSIGSILQLALEIYSWMLLAYVLMSWVNPDPYNPIVRFLSNTVEPVLRLCRNLLPPIGGLDLSPILAFFGIMVLQRVVAVLFSGMSAGMGMISLLFELLRLLYLLGTLFLLLLMARAGLTFWSWRNFRQRRPAGFDLRNPVIRFVFTATERVVRPLRGGVPTWSGMDLSPLVAALIMFLALLLAEEGAALVMGAVAQPRSVAVGSQTAPSALPAEEFPALPSRSPTGESPSKPPPRPF